MEDEIFNFLKSYQFRHWWFRGRSKIIESFVFDKNWLAGEFGVLDIGTGYGALIPVLKNIGSVDVIEPFEGAYNDLRMIGVRNIFNISDFPTNYPEFKYDYVTMFDVLEHIEDDSKALKIIKDKLLVPEGKIVLTVPSYGWLWSEHDEVNKHFRRYNRSQIKTLLALAGFRNIRTTYFMTILFPVAVLQRLIEKYITKNYVDLRMPNNLINRIMAYIFSLEAVAIRHINLPFGLSLIASGQT